jgi:transaldolase
MTTNHLLEIKDFCQSIWMDNLSRDLIESGDLKNMIVEKGSRGITSNSAIFIDGVTDMNRQAKLEAVKGKVAIANAKIAYQEYKKIIQSDRWKALSAKGANIQRLLWASTSTKNPEYSDVMYVDELIEPNTVNTLPPSTIDACADHCDVANRVETNTEEAYQLIDSLKDPEIDLNLDQVMDELLTEGINKFVKPFISLMNALEEKAQALSPVS